MDRIVVDADDRTYPRLVRRFVEFYCAVKISGVGERERVHAFRLGGTYQLVNLRERLKEGVVAVRVEVYESRSHRYSIASCYASCMDTILGVDEAGRGPLAGPVAVGVDGLRTNENELGLAGDTGGRPQGGLQLAPLHAR